MLVNYSSDVLASAVICLVGWITFLPQFFCATTTCPPPDFPEGGNYTPVNTEYEVGMKVWYYCEYGFRRFGEDSIKCQSTGKWSGKTPFCDSPVKLNNPTASTLKEGSMGPSSIIDGNPMTCLKTSWASTSVDVRVFLDPPSAVFLVMMYLTEGRNQFTISLSNDAHRRKVHCENYNEELAESIWVPFYCDSKGLRVRYVTVRVSKESLSGLTLCEMEVYAKENDWCQDPPENNLPNSQLQVSRYRADFKCNEGFKPKDKGRIYASCESNKWSRLPVQCEEIFDPFTVEDSTEGVWDIEDKTSQVSVRTNSTLKCKPGYHIEEETSTVTCLEDAKSNGTEPPRKTTIQETSLSDEIGCSYMNKYHPSGEKIETNEPCLNCTCFGNILMCYLRVCPFVKPLDENCVSEKHVGDCCPTFWCPQAPVQETSLSNEKGCSYMDKYHPSGEKIETNDPCLNCTCVGNTRLCYLRLCPFVKPLAENCFPEKHVGDCCPSFWCPQVYPPSPKEKPDTEPRVFPPSPTEKPDTNPIVRPHSTTENPDTEPREDEPQKDSKDNIEDKPHKDSKSIIAGIVGTVVVLIIFILLCLAIYFFRKKSKEVVVFYQTSEDNSFPTPYSFDGQSLSGLSAAEISNAYVEIL